MRLVESNILVTLATQRTGTKVLGNALNCGALVVSVGEIFSHESEHPLAFRRFVQRGMNFDRYLSGLWNDLLDEYFMELGKLSRFVHFDLMYNNLAFFGPLWWQKYQQNPLLWYLRSRKFGVIHLMRDTVQSYLSAKSSTASGTFHVYDEKASRNIGETFVDLSEYKEYRGFVKHWADKIEDAFEGYPHFLRATLPNMLNGENGYLNIDFKRSLSEWFGGGELEPFIQCLPVDIRPTHSYSLERVPNIVDLRSVDRLLAIRGL